MSLSGGLGADHFNEHSSDTSSPDDEFNLSQSLGNISVEEDDSDEPDASAEIPSSDGELSGETARMHVKVKLFLMSKALSYITAACTIVHYRTLCLQLRK